MSDAQITIPVSQRAQTAVWFSRKQAANYLTSMGCPISAATLGNLANNNNRGKGPPYTRFRWSQVRYLKTDLDAWAAREAVRIT